MKSTAAQTRCTTRQSSLFACIWLASLLITSVLSPAQAAPGDVDPTFSNGGTALFGGFRYSSVALQGDGKVIIAGSPVADFFSYFSVARFTAAGALDPTFNSTGVVATQLIGSTNDEARSVAVQIDGKIVVVGGTAFNFAVLRYTSTGELDTEFNGTGFVTTSIAFDDLALSVALQSDGKIVVAGRAGTAIALVRYTSTGQLDSSFNGTGIVTTPIGIQAIGQTVAVQSDGKIVVAGTCTAGSSSDFAVVRYTSTGALDTSFNGTGIVTTPVGPGDDEAFDLAVQSDGKIVVAGSSRNATNSAFALVRYTGAGALDSSFNGTGIVTTDLGNWDDVWNSVVVQSDGGIVAAGSSAGDFAVARYTPEGALDPTFNGNGIAVTDFSGPIARSHGFLGTARADEVQSIALQTDGKIVAAGTSYPGGGSNAAVARYTTAGVLDTTFNPKPPVTTDIGTSDTGSSIAVQSDGKIVVAGAAAEGGISDFAVARYLPTGALDPSFNGTGFVVTDLGSSQDAGRSVAIQSDGRILVAGTFFNGSNLDFALVRYTSTGALDTTFNGTGIVTTPIGSGNDEASSVALQRDGRIVVAGTAVVGNSNFAVVRYNADGSLDTSFSGDGKVDTNITTQDIGRGVAVQSDGRIVVVGSSTQGASQVVSLVRYLADGTLDTSFSGDGKATTVIGSVESYVASVVVQCDGRIIVAGYADNGSGGDFALLRYTSAGNLDTTFNGTGKVLTDLGFQTPDEAYSVSVQSDGRILVAGTNGVDFALVRYTGTGALDPTFHSTGKVITNISATMSSLDRGASVAVQSDGKIFVAGTTSFESGFTDFAVVRYEADTAQQMFSTVTAAAGLTGPAANPLASPFHDGVENLLKYAFKLNLAGPDMHPLSPADCSGLPVAQLVQNGGQSFWQVRFVRRKGSGLIYTPLKSITLENGSFLPMTGPMTVQGLDAQFEEVTVLEPLDLGVDTRFFSKVQVTLP